MLIACSLTGVDASTDLDAISELAERHPIVEFGVLYSHSRAGNDPRYPTLDVIRRLARRAYRDRFAVALHLCGSAVGDFVSGRGEVRELATDLFGRVQLNFSAATAPFTARELDGAICTFPGSVITQHNDANRDVSLAVTSRNHHVLFDASLGRGIRAGSWPDPLPGKTCGYAGGISPDNVGEVLGELAGAIASGETECWIDMESRLRNADDLFDLDACRRVLEAVDRLAAPKVS